jgi:hypothetical protein
MMDHFILLTPLLLLPVFALLGFAGCNAVFGIDPTTLAQPIPVVHVQTVVKSAPAGSNSITADPLTLTGGELLIVTVQWASSAVLQPSPTLTGATLAPVMDPPFGWNGMKIQSFFGINPANTTSVVVKAQLVGGSIIPWNLCVSAYTSYDPDNPVYTPISNPATFVGTDIKSPPINVGQGDMIYAVAFAADNSGTFPGSNPLAPAPGFTAEFPAINNPLVEDGGTGNPVTAEALNATTSTNPRGFIFAMGIKALPE